MSNGKTIDPTEQARLGLQLRDDACRALRMALRSWTLANRIDPHHHQPESLMGIEATVINGLVKQNGDLKQQLATLQGTIPPAANIKDADDLTAEAAGEAALGIDASGNPLAQAAAPPAQ